MSDAGVAVVVGKPGSGKSFYAVRAIVMAVLRGEPVLTNVPLREGWQDQVAKMRFGILRGKKWRTRRAAALLALVYYFEDPQLLPRIGVPGCGKCEHCRAGRTCTKEGRALAVVDEAPKFLDARTWNLAGDGEEGGKPVVMRKKVVDFFRMHRKRGFGVLLLTQAETLLDSQVRGMGERYIGLRNLRRIPHLLNPLWYLRFDLFCATTYWGVPGKTGTLRAKTEWFLLNKRIARLYDTMGGFASDGSEEADVWPWGRTPGLKAEIEEAPQRSEDVDSSSAAEDRRAGDQEQDVKPFAVLLGAAVADADV
jgi:hypothetical protein